MSENYQAILNHLLFHKSLISEVDGGGRINRYLSMLNEIDQGMHVAVRDPFEKSVAAAFELVLEEQLDPWEIDLVQFTRLYLDKVRKDGVVNFVTAGKLVFLAWSILKLQTDKVLLDAMPPEPEPSAEGWDLDLYREPEDLDYNHLILQDARMPLSEAIRREGRRAVTLMELMDAFDEARRESEIQLQLNALREAAVRRFAPNFHQKVHGEDVAEDIGLTWSRLCRFDGGPVPLSSLVVGGVWDEITVFMSILFLVQLRKIQLWQKNFPHGEIYVKRLVSEGELHPEELVVLQAPTAKTEVPADPGVAA